MSDATSGGPRLQLSCFLLLSELTLTYVTYICSIFLTVTHWNMCWVIEQGHRGTACCKFTACYIELTVKQPMWRLIQSQGFMLSVSLLSTTQVLYETTFWCSPHGPFLHCVIILCFKYSITIRNIYKWWIRSCFRFPAPCFKICSV